MNLKPCLERRWCAALHIFTAIRLASLPTTAFYFQSPRLKVRTLFNFAVNEKFRWFFFKILRVSWSVRNTKIQVSPSMVRKWFMPLPVHKFPNLPLLSETVMAPEIMPCVAGVIIHDFY